MIFKNNSKTIIDQGVIVRHVFLQQANPSLFKIVLTTTLIYNCCCMLYI